MNLPDSLVMELLDELDRLDQLDKKSKRGSVHAAQLRALIFDQVLATLTPPQRRLLERWRGYVCSQCGRRLVIDPGVLP